ncbi:hypothetical protein HDU76_013001 [Blyttiomyces sp. JEL0837]|nr:hypothetical protein HDU76_013001 [Blyttiomyces sp. JEL0837]
MGQEILHVAEGLLVGAIVIGGGTYIAHEFHQHHDDKTKEESWIHAATAQQQQAQAQGSQLYWAFAHHGQLPHNAIRVGTDSDGAPLFAARCYHDHSIQVGKARQGNRECSIAFGGREIGVDRFQVLCGNANVIRWVEVRGRFNYQMMNVNAILGGQDKDSSPLFIAIADVEGHQPGKAGANLHGCNFAWAGGEHTAQVYRVATIGPLIQSTPQYMPPSMPPPQTIYAPPSNPPPQTIYAPPPMPPPGQVQVQYQPPAPQQSYNQVYWSQAHGDCMPMNAIPIGRDSDGQPLYAARCHFNGSIQVGKAREGDGISFPYGGREVGEISNYEVLCGNPHAIHWVSVSGAFNHHALNCTPVEAGRDGNGASLFVAVADVHGSQPGKAGHHLHHGMSYSYGGGEHSAHSYRVAVL